MCRPLLSLTLFLAFAQIVSCQSCVDRLHFYYKCASLAKYCHYPKAARIRRSCPVTCGMCRQDLDAGRRPPATPRVFRPAPAPTTTRPAVVRPVAALPRTIRPLVLTRPAPRPTAPAPVRRPTPPARQRPSGSFERPVERGNQQPVVDMNALADARLSECCKFNKISSHCVSLCTYDISKEQILAKAGAGFCTLHDAQIWMTCASGRKKNAQCCRSAGVHNCDDLCNGKVNLHQMLQCVQGHLAPILDCHKHNYYN